MSTRIRIPSLIQAAALALLVLGAASCAMDDHALSAANAPQAGSSRDLLGDNGPQDALAREIYHPGRGTDW